MASSTTPQTVTIDGKHYERDQLSQNALTQLDNLRFVDQELNEANNRIAVLNTARSAYARVLAEHLPEKKAPANKKKDVVTIDGEKYNRGDFSEEGQSQLANLQFTEEEIAKTRNRAAVLQTARGSYAQALSDEIKEVQPATPH